MTPNELPPIDADLAGTLRSEAEGMASAYAATLLELPGAESVVGIYVKGSVCKA